MKERLKDANKQLNQERQAEYLAHQSFQQELEKDYHYVPPHQRLTSLANDVSESKYEQEYRDFFYQKELKAIQWTTAWGNRIEKLRARVSLFFFCLPLFHFH